VDDPDAIVDATAAAFRSAIFGNGDVNVVQGDRRAVSRLLKVFPRPTPA
jgi:hypothetical protein